MNDFVVETTNKRVIIRINGIVVGEAGAQNAKDFDFDVLYRLALHQSGSQILGLNVKNE